MDTLETSLAKVDNEIQDADLLKDEPASDELSSAEGSRRPSQVLGQKRRRVTRACDECRRKKIKCDGKQPCTHCTVYSYDCTYDQPSHRRRNPGPQYIESLERRLQRAEAALHSIAPHIDLNDPTWDNSPDSAVSVTPLQDTAQREHETERSAKETPALSGKPDPGGLESMIRATGQLDLDEKGHWDYYGHSSGLNFLRRIRDQFGNVLSPEAAGSRSATVGRSRTMNQDFTSPSSPGHVGDSPFETMRTGSHDLPPKETAQKLCSGALDDGSAILNLVHKPSFYQAFDRIYDLPQDAHEPEDAVFLPLLYSVLALGSLFDKTEESELEQSGYEGATSQGYKYFKAARNLLDITDCRDMISLQALIYMILFLQCSAKLSTCYSYIGVALRSALRMGLHRSFRDGFSPIEAETRKRAFWVIRKMDVYVGAMLGLPLTLSDDDFDQDLPSEVDDDYITETEILPMPAGTVPVASAAHANFRLAKILGKIVKHIYPIKTTQNFDQNPTRTYSVSFVTLYELEKDLKSWEEGLPAALKPGGVKPPSHIGPMQQLLRMAYAHAQMMLYRPFLHYTSPRSKPNSVDTRAYGCSVACVSVSRNVIKIATEMKKEGLLVGSYWFTMYTCFFAVLSLLYYASENPDSADAQAVIEDAREGQQTLAQLAKRSMAADRCTTTLKSVFESLDTTLKTIGLQTKNPSTSTGRKCEVKPSLGDVRMAQSHENLPKVAGPGIMQRAKTFPPNNVHDGQRVDAKSRSHKSQKKSPESSRTRKSQPRLTLGLKGGKLPSDCSIVSPKSAPEASRAETPSKYTQPSYSHAPSEQRQAHQHQPNSSFHHSAQVHVHPQASQQQSQYLPQQMEDVQYGTNLSDLSAMMFPSADPFAYPNQPMTTLDQHYAYHHGMPLNSTREDDEFNQGGTSNYMIDSSRGMHSSGSNEHVDVQLFGPLPPYLLQSAGSGPGYHQAQQQLTGMEGVAQGTAGGGPQMWADQNRGHGLDNFNYEDVFGNEEEWRGSFM